jgi:hypothetical protein
MAQADRQALGVHRAAFQVKINGAGCPVSLLRTTAVQCSVLMFQEARMAIYHRAIAALLVSAVLTACASTPTPGAGAAASAATPLPQRVYVTGSHIAQPVDPHTGLPETASPLQIVTQDDLNRSGHIDLGSALRELVPALH